MNISKVFKSLLESMNVNFKQFENITLLDENGSKYPLLEPDNKILSFEWARFLAQKNEIVLLNNSQDTMESIDIFEKFVQNKTGSNVNLGKLYRDDLKHCDYGRFENAKDIYYLIRDICGEIRSLKEFKDTYAMYIESGKADEFLLCFVKSKKLKNFNKLAEKLGIHSFYILGSANGGGLYKNTYQNCTVNGKTIAKNFYNNSRNEDLIKQLKAEKQKTRMEQLNFEMSKKDDEKFSALSQKLYDEISEFGLASLEGKNPKLSIKEFLVDIFKILLYKKWVAYKDIVNLERDSGYFFHLYEDGAQIPPKQELIFDIIDTVNENK